MAQFELADQPPSARGEALLSPSRLSLSLSSLYPPSSPLYPPPSVPADSRASRSGEAMTLVSPERVRRNSNKQLFWSLQLGSRPRGRERGAASWDMTAFFAAAGHRGARDEGRQVVQLSPITTTGRQRAERVGYTVHE